MMILFPWMKKVLKYDPFFKHNKNIFELLSS